MSAAAGQQEAGGTIPPSVIVIGPPWLRTGTGRVIEDQIAYYRDRGYATAFVAVPLDPSQVKENPMWVEFAQSARDLATRHAYFAALDPAPAPNTLRRRALHRWHGLTALDWIVEVAGCATPSASLRAFAREWPVSLIHVNHVFTLGFARRLRAELEDGGPAIPVIVETHDVQADILHQRHERNPWTGRPDGLERLQAAEIALLQDHEILVHCSVDDCGYFQKLFPRKSHIIARPVIDSGFIAAVADRAALPEPEPIDVLFVGTGYAANVDALDWLLNEVWPIVADRDWRLKIVGGIDHLMRLRSPATFERFRTCFTGRVADLAPFYRAARCVVAPMRSGGGISVKTIEAFALGIPFIGTTKAYRGFPKEPLERSGIRAFDDPGEFAGAIARAIAGMDDSATKGRAIYDELFSREACYAARDEAVRLALMAAPQPRRFSTRFRWK